MQSQGFWRRALADPSWTAAVEPDGTSHTAGDLLARVNQLTHGLQARGLRPGDGLAVLARTGWLSPARSGSRGRSPSS